MIEVQQIADFLNTELNNIGKSQGYNFDIKAEVGERTNQDAIYGIVTTTKADARVDENVDYVFAIELSVPSAKTNENVINVEKIIGEFKNKFHMKNRAFGGGQGTLLISLATPKDYQIKYVVGDDVPLVFTITTEYIRNAVGSGDKHWLLNGMEIPFINESVSVQKEGRTNTIHGESYTKTLLTRQTRYYKFGFDYDNSELCIMLKKDLLDGKYDKVYTLTYYDGVSFTEEQPFTTSVSIFANGQSSSTKPNVSEFDITFTDVDNEEEAEYFMALIDNPFDSTTENTRYFPNEEEQRRYYQEKIDNDIRVGGVGCQFVKIKAPNLSSIDITNQVYEIPLHDDKPIYDVLSVTNKNYAIIKVKKGEDEQWFYYYVSNQNIGGQNQVMFDLKLDSVQTYCIGDKLQFGECLIERGHLNRWVDNGDGTVSFDGTIDSKLFEREDIQNVAKRLTKRTKVGINNHNQPELDDWLNNNIYAWLYLYLSPRQEYNIKEFITDTDDKDTFYTLKHKSEESSDVYEETCIPSNMACICVPIMKEYSNSLYFRMTTSSGENIDSRINIRAITSFLNNNNDYSHVYATKVSYMPPFPNEPINYLIENNDLYLVSTDHSSSPPSLFNQSIVCYKAHANGCFLNVRVQTNELISKAYSISEKLSFNKSNIIGADKQAKFNPKLLSQDYKELTVGDNSGNGFIYDIQKLNKETFSILATESFVPDFSTIYLRINNSNSNGLYIPETNNNLTGFIDDNVNSIVMPTDQYESMLANNKNFYKQNNLNRKAQLARDIAGVGNSILGISQASSSAQALSTAWGAIAGGMTTALNYAQSTVNQRLSVDDLRNSPDMIVSAKGNVIFETMCSKYGIIVEEYDILPNEKEMINDYMCKYGFTVNRFGNPKDYYDIRHYYNYVKAQIDSVSGIAISNQARDDIRQRFANGVRFWKQDEIDYSKENYEEWLAQ